MTSSSPYLADRFRGCLLGLVVGDALGAHFEGRSAEGIARRYRSPRELASKPPSAPWSYTDDTQMAIGVAQTLIAHRRIDPKALAKQFAANFEPYRGYGRGTRLTLEAIQDGLDHEDLASNLLPGGSFGNGAAMRVAPVGLMFRHNQHLLWEQARLSALPTHLHPLGIEGAQLLALAVGLASYAESIDRGEFFQILADRCTSAEYSGL